MLTSIVGINWGDEGKGRMVDLLSENYDIVCRYQGGNNAGHTIIKDGMKVVLNLLPSGILRDNTVNVLGTGMVIDVKHLFNEVKKLREQGIKITPENLKISDRATICMPYHVLLDGLEEDRLGDAKFGSTRRGIAPVYADKYMKKTFRMGDILHFDYLLKKLPSIIEWKNLTVVGGYKAEPIKVDEIVNWLETYALPFKDYIVNTTEYLSEEIKKGKSIMFEAQLGALRDIDFGIYPYTSSSSTISAYAPIGAGIPGEKLTNVIGIMKAYSTCVGEGPFTAEMFGDEGEALRKAGGEYGAATGRPRRVGAFDVVASRYGVKIQGADTIALTKLDVLSYLDKIPVCVAYEVNGEITTVFPSGEALNKAKPVIEYLDGFGDVSKCRTWASLPENAKKYIKFIERTVGCRIGYISVGADREEYIKVD